MPRLRSALVLPLVVLPLLAAGSAYAAVSDADAAAPQISVQQQDGRGDVHVDRSMRGTLTHRALASVDVAHVDTELDRVASTLTVTYTVRRGPVAVKGMRQYFATVGMADPADPAGGFVVVMSRPGSHAVRVVTADDFRGVRCAGGTSTVTKAGRVVTQVVPFACLDGLEHARLTAGVGLDSRKGDGAWDTVKRTRDLPLTAYVDPAA